CLYLSHWPSVRCASYSIRRRSSEVISWPWSRAIFSAQLANQSRIAPASQDLQARLKSFASFLYCSRLGRGGRGSASDIRISFQYVPGVRVNQAERRFVALRLVVSGWALPFPRTGCAPFARKLFTMPREESEMRNSKCGNGSRQFKRKRK